MACFRRFSLCTVYSVAQIRIYDFSSNIQSCAIIAYAVEQAETIIFRSFYSAALVDYTTEIYSLGSHIVSEAKLAHFHHAVVASSYQPTTGLLAQLILENREGVGVSTRQSEQTQPLAPSLRCPAAGAFRCLVFAPYPRRRYCPMLGRPS